MWGKGHTVFACCVSCHIPSFTPLNFGVDFSFWSTTFFFCLFFFSVWILGSNVWMFTFCFATVESSVEVCSYRLCVRVCFPSGGAGAEDDPEWVWPAGRDHPSTVGGHQQHARTWWSFQLLLNTTLNISKLNQPACSVWFCMCSFHNAPPAGFSFPVLFWTCTLSVSMFPAAAWLYIALMLS